MKTLKNRFRLLLLLMVMPAVAQATTSVGLSTIMSTFQSTTQGWYSAIFTDALGLFGALFGIEVTWLVVTWLIGGKDVHDIFSSFIKKLLTIGFFYTVLESSSQWVPWVIGGFKNVAASAGGEPITTVGDIAMTGVRAFVICIEAGPMAMVHDASSFWSNVWNLNLSGAASSLASLGSADLGTATGINLLVGAIVGLIMLFSFTYVVLELVAVQLEGMIVLSVGVIMLGFGGARWTARFVESYMQYSVSVGVRLMVITLWASFIEWQVNPLIKTTLINGNASMGSFAIVLILALLIAWLTKKLPGFANSILSGQSTLSGGELYNAVKGGAIAAAAVVTGGAVLAAGSTGAGALSAAEGAAGSSGAGSLGASQASLQPAGSSEAGSLQASEGVPAPTAPAAPQSGPLLPPVSGQATPSGSQAPAPSGSQAPATGGQAASSGSQAPALATASDSQATPSGLAPASDSQAAAPSGSAPASDSQATPSGGQADLSSSPPSGKAPAPSGQTTTSGGHAPAKATASDSPAAAPSGSATASGVQAPASGQAPLDPVDHRSSTPNESTPGTTTGGSVQAPGTGSGKGGDGSGKGDPEQKPPTPVDLAKDAFTQTQAALHGAHDTLTPGSPSHTGVQAPSLGIKHLSD